MAKNKCEYLFISGVDPKIQEHRPYATIEFLNGKTFKGCNGYSVFWVGKKPYGAYGTKAWRQMPMYNQEKVNRDITHILSVNPLDPR